MFIHAVIMVKLVLSLDGLPVRRGDGGEPGHTHTFKHLKRHVAPMTCKQPERVHAFGVLMPIRQ